MVFCEICKKEFKNKGFSSHIIRVHKIQPKEYYDLYVKKDHNEGLCKTCGNNTEFLTITTGYRKYCSKECSNKSSETRQKTKQTCLEKYGCEYAFQSEEVKHKIKKFYRDNYNVEVPTQLDSVKQKSKKTNLNKLGVENPSQSEEIKNKKRNTFINHYGVPNCFSSEDIKNRIKQTCINRYGVENPNQSFEVRNNKNIQFFNETISPFINKINIELVDNEYKGSRFKHNWKCLTCGNIFTSWWELIQMGGGKCPVCFPKYESSYELEISEFIESLGVSIIRNSREIIPPKEIDIYIPDYNLAIEFNGLYWHSDKIKEDINYHNNKLNKCIEKGIRLIHIFEDEWVFKHDIIKEKLKLLLNINNKPRIHARKCTIKEIDSKTKNLFLDKYHLQGKDSSSIKLGAFCNDELISVMTFSKSNISRGFYKKEGSWELTRFASNYNYHIPGIASKLLSYFEKHYDWNEIFTYADKRWSTGNLYYKLGFSYNHETKPNYWYVLNGVRIHRFALRKTENDPQDIPEWIIRESEGYLRVWDCGNIRFSIHNKSL